MRPNYTLPRLYLDQRMSGEIDLDRAQANYFGTVLRKQVGDCVRLFNAQDGEWAAEIVEKGRKTMRLAVREQLRDPLRVPDIRLLFAPLRKHRTTIVIEKATELGVRILQPVVTERTQFQTFNMERAQSQVIEAAEQTERLDLPTLFEPIGLDEALKSSRPLIFADEAGGECVVGAVSSIGLPVDVLIGPEGGFTHDERERIRALDRTVPVTLGPRILRADTAAIGLLMLIQSTIGDCRITA
ncbi:16S rRNA (uracil(1498)-N(3))-methyltransferase [Algimonas porphyrae]|uniref:Ribosomal RNA small subunit methyltransferase E n=1 Tax=Algimonas porphyrae TaxID=1128113 RepID=A0ABQ5V089_9PROT|nr:16S rRNA (uracil(1498)-N(3))-methyltransferase [Algimonas porphyrae]GLQ20031.1 ribosomal RNA small subunit methyltransferase E [Algimonas porphyrae]